jgi:alkyl sulfatase BDS1-like metallo-beta-lactamase superfamily hydrolase
VRAASEETDGRRVVSRLGTVTLVAASPGRPRAEGKRIALNWKLQRREAADADASLTLPRDVLAAITLRKTAFPEAVKSSAIQVAGDPNKLLELLGLFDNVEPMFEVMEPKPAR